MAPVSGFFKITLLLCIQVTCIYYCSQVLLLGTNFMDLQSNLLICFLTTYYSSVANLFFFHPALKCLNGTVLVTGSPLTGTGRRCEEGVDVCGLTSGAGRLHLRLLFRNLQDLTQLFKVHHLEEGHGIYISDQFQ